MQPPDDAQPRVLQRTFKRTSAFILVGLLLTAPIAWGVLASTAAPREAGHEFIAALREGDYDLAFEMCTEDLQKHLGSPEELKRLTIPVSLPKSCWWTSSERRGDEANLNSSIKTWWSRSGVSIRLNNSEGNWRIARMSAGTDKGRMELAVPRQ